MLATTSIYSRLHHLEHGQQGDGKGVKVGRRATLGKIESSPKELHEEEEEKEKGDEGAHRAQ